ncbi:MAG: prepilin-type N-terminal cleavage/methylation domain-containing protein [Hyphomonas sp.]|nr:prepilin-type N-terminal cleavage/methylation domain-containing protein [Hyphomonas sp.]
MKTPADSGHPPPGSGQANRHSESGYSLIEVVVSLAILALTATIVVPNAVDMVSRFQAQADLRSIIDQIQNQRERAISTGQARIIGLPESDVSVSGIDLPKGWRLEFLSPLSFSQAGVCQGDGLTIITQAGSRHYYSLDARTCRLEGQ